MPDQPRPGAKRRALVEEQAHVDRVHDRVEELRRAAAALRSRAEADRAGSTFQAVYERDVTAHHHAARAARYTFGDEEPLVFGRLDLADAEVFHIGRVAVTDAEREPLLVDWRAPVAAAFYRATAAAPQGVARRRTLTCRGRELLDLDDEVIDAEAADRLGLTAVTGQGALLAALTRTRTGRMRDIVATIQGDQDRIIRLPATGTVIVSGGPGTGKTVVALHRVAYLLYTNRDRFQRRGVLVVGPTDVFTRYIGNVLPALGEDRAVLRSIADLAEGRVPISGWDEPEVAAVKGDLAMIEVCRRAVRAALPPLDTGLRFAFDGTTVEIPVRDLEEVRDRVWRRTQPVDADGRGGYHSRRVDVEDALLGLMWRRWRSARRAAGRRAPDERVGSGFDATLRDQPEIEAALDRLWPTLDAASVFGALADGTIDLAAVAEDVLAPDALARLRTVWRAGTAREHATIDDVAVIDEIASLLGPVRAPEDVAPPDDGGIRLSIDRLESAAVDVDVDAADYRDFAHVVVDEAQDLTPMQWRTLARRAPHASWTIVGDLAQRSRVAEPSTWQDIATLVGRRQVTIETLRVNYRTPTEVMDLARAVLDEAGFDPDVAPEAVRDTGQLPALIRADDVLAATAAQALEIASEREGTVAIVVPDSDVAPARARLEDALQERPDADRADLTDRVRVFDPRTVKGLEFDGVVVGHPDRIAAGSAVGLHHLYVVVTRATMQLRLVATPDAVVPAAALTDERRVAA